METEVVEMVKQLERQADGTTVLFLKVCKGWDLVRNGVYFV